MALRAGGWLCPFRMFFSSSFHCCCWWCLLLLFLFHSSIAASVAAIWPLPVYSCVKFASFANFALSRAPQPNKMKNGRNGAVHLFIHCGPPKRLKYTYIYRILKCMKYKYMYTAKIKVDFFSLMVHIAQCAFRFAFFFILFEFTLFFLFLI